jgi:hypothetical protein
VEPGEQGGGRRRSPLVLEPALAHLGVGPTADPAGRLIAPAPFANVAEVAVVAERKAAGRIVERLGVGRPERGELRRPAEVNEDRRADDVTDETPARIVVAERSDVAV